MDTGSEPAPRTAGDQATGGQENGEHGMSDGIVSAVLVPEVLESRGYQDEIAGKQAVEEDDGCEAQPGGNPLYEKVKNLNRFIDETARGLDPISFCVWMTLFRFARGGIAWASQKTIADRLGLDLKTVCRHIAILKRKKLVRVVKEGHRGGRANTYQLGILPLEAVPKRPARSQPKPR
jgi:hypothetical protein